MRLPAGSGRAPLSVDLSGLIPRASYHFELVASSSSGTTYGEQETFTAPGPPTVPAGVMVGPISLGGATKAAALRRLEEFLAAPLRFTFEGVYWSAPRATLGAEIDPAGTYAKALAAPPGSHLQLELTINQQRLRSYLTNVNARFAHPEQSAAIRLQRSHAVVQAAKPKVEVDLQRMTAAVRSALDSGLSERLGLAVETGSSNSSHNTPAKAVVIRLGRQTLTAYLNGKPILTTPVTTGRSALPTPVGNYHVIFRASPFVFHSPWPPGSPFWYPPTPVTWAMDFFGGDFLHDDPGEPSDAFGAGSEDGPYASHGCVHVPHDVMSFLYRWLPIGSQVVVAES